MGSKAPVRTPDNLRSKDEFELMIGLSEGPIEGLVSGDKSFYVGDTPLQNSDDSYNFELFETKLFPGDAVAEQVEPRMGGLSNSTSVGVTLAPSTSVTRQTASGAIDFIEVRLVVSSLYQERDDGIFNSTGSWRIEYKPSDAPSTDWAKFFDQDLTITGKTTSNYAVEYRQAVTRLTCPYDIRVTRLTAADTGGHHLTVNWESFQEVDETKRTYHNTALMLVSGQATDQLSSVPAFKGVYRGLKIKVPTNYNPVTRAYTGLWDGTFKIAWTNNSAWILYDIVMNTRYGIASYETVNLDKYDVYDAGQWCDTLVDDGAGGLEPRYTFNNVIQEARSGKELARYIAGTFNAAIVDNLDGSLGLRVDKDETATALFTPENVTDAGFEYSYTDTANRYNDITVTFINPDLDWAEDRRRVKDQPSIDSHGRIPLDFIAVGCTKESEAIRRAQYKLLTCLTEKEMVKFSTNRLGMFVSEWQVILIADPDMGYAVSGRIKSINGARTVITLRDPVYLEVGIDYKIKVQYASSVVEREVLPVSTGNTTTLVLPTPLPAGVPTNAVFSLEDQAGGLNGLPKPYRVVSVTESDGNPDMFEISAIEINRFKFDDADGLDEITSPTYRNNPGSVIAAPTNLTFTNVSFTASDGTYRPRLRLDWTPPVGMVNITYEVQYRIATDTAFENTIIIPDGTTFAVLTVLEDRQDWTARVRAKNTLGVYSEWVEATSEDEIPNDAPPGVCTGLTATGGFKNISLQWANPSDLDLRGIKIFVNTVNDPDTATFLAETMSTFFVHGGLGTNATRYYWLRAVDRSGNVGDLNSNLGTGAITTQIQASDAVEDFIDSSLILPAITGAVDAHPVVISHSRAVLNLIDLVNTRFNELRALTGTSTRTFTLHEQTLETIQTDVLAEVTQREILAAQVDDNTAAIITESTARADGDSALASTISILSAQVSDNAAAISTETTARATADSALASQITTLTATVGTNTAAIATEVTARTTAVSAVASSLSTLTTTVGTNTSSISVLTSSVDGLEAQYVVRINANNRISGFGLASGAGGTSEFAIMADKFALAFPTSPGETPIVPFLIESVGGTPTLYFQGKIIADSIDAQLITGAMIVNGGVGTNQIGTGGVWTTNIYGGAVSANYYATDSYVGLIPSASIMGACSIGSLSVSSGEIGNYRLHLTATADSEYTGLIDIEVYWRIANNINAVTPWQLLGGQTTDGVNDFYYDGKKTLSVNYTPVSTSEATYEVQFYSNVDVSSAALNVDFAVSVFKR